jgi:hypothetical protein
VGGEPNDGAGWTSVGLTARDLPKSAASVEAFFLLDLHIVIKLMSLGVYSICLSLLSDLY